MFFMHLLSVIGVGVSRDVIISLIIALYSFRQSSGCLQTNCLLFYLRDGVG